MLFARVLTYHLSSIRWDLGSFYGKSMETASALIAKIKQERMDLLKSADAQIEGSETRKELATFYGHLENLLAFVCEDDNQHAPGLPHLIHEVISGATEDGLGKHLNAQICHGAAGLLHQKVALESLVARAATALMQVTGSNSVSTNIPSACAENQGPNKNKGGESEGERWPH